MRRLDFFHEDSEQDPFGVPQNTLDTQLIKGLHDGTNDLQDIEAAVGLAHLVHDEFVEHGTGKNSLLTNDESRGIMAALKSVLRRINVAFDPEFRDFEDFERFWKRRGLSGDGGYQARRDVLYDLMDPIHERLADIAAGAPDDDLAAPITSHPRTGWTVVDEEISELRRHFKAAQSSQDYRNIGNDCVAVLERLSGIAYVAERHAVHGEEVPGVARTKDRLDRVVEVDLQGRSNAELRKLVRAAIEQAQAVKHRSPNRRQAGIAGDSVILLANIFRRLAEPEE